jgi:hypothetical protein
MIIYLYNHIILVPHLAPAWQLGTRRDEGLVLIKPEETGKVVKRDKFNNPPRVVPCQFS